MFMGATDLHQDDVFFGDDSQLGVGEYLVVVEERQEEEHDEPCEEASHNHRNQHRFISIPTSSTSAVEQWDELMEEGSSTAEPSHMDMQFIAKNTTQVLIEREQESHGEMQISRGPKRKYSMKNRPKASYYKCKMCDVVVKHPSKILEHIRIHTGERPFPCPHCQLTFTQAGALTAHLRIHNGDRPFHCAFCAKKFTTSGQRSAHQKSCRMAEGVQEESGHHVVTRKQARFNRIPPILRPMTKNLFRKSKIQQNSQNSQKREEDEERREREPTSSRLNQMIDVEEQTSAAQKRQDMAFQQQQQQQQEFRTDALNKLASSEDNIEDEDDLDGTFLLAEQHHHLRSIPSRSKSGFREQQQELQQGDSPYLVKQEILVDVEGPHEDQLHQQEASQVEFFIEEAEEEEFEEANGVQELPSVSAQEGSRRSLRRTIPVYAAKSQPPSKGRKRQDQDEEVEKVYVDSALYAFAAPQTMDNGSSLGVKSSRRQRMATTSESRKQAQLPRHHQHRPAQMAEDDELLEQKPARNLDWIIDAIAEGKCVDKASPHSRRLATFHTCEHCGLELKYPSKIAAHMRTHTKEKPFKCEICGAGFAQNTTLRMHLRRHLDQKPYECPDPQCGQRFINGGLLNAHIQKRHTQPRRFACLNGCSKILNSNAERQKHERNGCHFLKFEFGGNPNDIGGGIELEDCHAGEHSGSFYDQYYY